MNFWTCGPFMEFQQRRELVNFRITQQMMLQSILDELQSVEDVIDSGSTEEKLIAAMMKQEIEAKLYTILGISDDGNGQTKSDEILRETILKSISGITKT